MTRVAGILRVGSTHETITVWQPAHFPNFLSFRLKIGLNSRWPFGKAFRSLQREGAFELTDEQRAELDRRWAEHVENPGSAIPWSEVRRKLLG